MNKKYTACAVNDQGASVCVGIDFDHPNGGRQFTSIASATRAARAELGSGWKVSIVNGDHEEVKSFTIR